MLSLVWDGERATPRERERPRPGPEMALVRVTLAGICNTDLEIVRGGYMGFRGVLGHEFAGVVEEGPEEWRGQRVVAEINFACGRCDTCRSGLPRHCPNRRVMGILDADGAFAEYTLVPVANLHRIPDSLPDRAAVFTEPLAAAFEILEQIEPEQQAGRAVVLGDGKLGLLVAQVLGQAGWDVLAVGKHRDKLDLLAGRGIETRLLEAWRSSPTADLVVEATGSAQGLQQALRALRPRGTLVLKSTFAGATQVDLAPVVIDEIRLVGSRCGPFPPALSALAGGAVEVDRLVSEDWPLSRGDEALRRAAEPGVLKVLLTCSG